MTKKTLCLLTLCFLGTASFAQKTLKDAELTIKSYSSAIESFALKPSGIQKDGVHTQIYGNLYEWTVENPDIIDFIYVYCDLDTIARQQGIYDSKTDSISINQYTDLINTLNNQKILITKIEYSVVEPLSQSENTIVLKLKKKVSYTDHGKEVNFANFERGTLRYNAKFDAWQLWSLQYMGSTDFEDEKQVVYESYTTILPPIDTVLTVAGVSFKMIYVKGGPFQMGCTSCDGLCQDNEKPIMQRSVTDYHIIETEVTQELWEAIMGPKSHSSSVKNPNHPVETDFSQARIFISRLNDSTHLNFRMPTETEWEYAARGGVKSRRYMYAGGNNLKEVCWGDGVSINGRSKPVKTKKPNELGLYDMSGNVWEWTSTPYVSYRKYGKEPTFITPKYAARGGCTASEAKDNRIAARKETPTNERLGFRLVLGSK